MHLEDGQMVEVKFKVGRYMKPIKLKRVGSIVEAHFAFNRGLLAIVKSMQGHKWHGFDKPTPRKIWTIDYSKRNIFQIEYLMQGNPYERYDGAIVKATPRRDNLRDHQLEMLEHGLTRHYCIWACEMGTGKTLPAIELMEHAVTDIKTSYEQAWYVGPKAGVKAVERELDKWNSRVFPTMYTYERLRRVIEDWEPGRKAPRVVIFDESSKIKTNTAQRSKAAMHIANAVREDWGDDGYVILLTGTPAPKSPVDWWHQCEVACPGFLREGEPNILKRNLCIIEQREGATGTFPHIVTWLDNELKCTHCGQFEEHRNHEMDELTMEVKCRFAKSSNEVTRLYKRMKGLVLVTFKKDCMDLPEKQYEEIILKPSVETLQAARIIKSTTGKVVTTLNLLRELSDGFQYKKEDSGVRDTCPACNGSGTYLTPVHKDGDDYDVTQPNNEVDGDDFEKELQPCAHCGGAKTVKKYVRGVHTVDSPKDKLLVDLLDEHDDLGRFVVWGGYTASVDKITDICLKHGWTVLRVDGRGYTALSPQSDVSPDADILLSCLDRSDPKQKDLLRNYPKVVFVGHPKAGGMALTLTASPTMFFYSNVYDGEARMQSEDRIHRIGMDENRGCRIIDAVHLPTDRLILENLRKKKKLQSLTLGDLEEAMKHEGDDNVR